MTDQCVTCGKTVEEAEDALSCDLCSQWEHVCCVRQRERPSEALYQALVHCNTKSLMYVCSCCRRQGPVAQRLFQYEKEAARANDERLASARLLEERDALIRELRNQNAELSAKHTSLQSDMLKLTQQLMAVQLESKSPRSACGQQEISVVQSPNCTARKSDGLSLPSGPPSLLDSGSEHSSDSMEEPPRSRRRTRTADLHPPGFTVLISRINKFSGEKAADNFEVWLEDYLEATGDCGWSNKD